MIDAIVVTITLVLMVFAARIIAEVRSRSMTAQDFKQEPARWIVTDGIHLEFRPGIPLQIRDAEVPDGLYRCLDVTYESGPQGGATRLKIRMVT